MSNIFKHVTIADDVLTNMDLSLCEVKLENIPKTLLFIEKRKPPGPEVVALQYTIVTSDPIGKGTSAVVGSRTLIPKLEVDIKCLP